MMANDDGSFDLGAVARPAVTVDIVVLTVRERRLEVLLVTRGREPFRGRFALPGGFVHVGEGDVGGESLDEAAIRELAEETGLDARHVLLEQFAVFGTPGRDPRGRVFSVAFFALVRPVLADVVKGGSDAAAAAFVSVEAARGLAFDHDGIVLGALQRLKDGVERGDDVAFALAPEPFTIRELQDVHEILLQRELLPGPFRKKFDRWLDDGRVEQVPGKRVTTKRPAAVFRCRPGNQP